MVGISLGWNCYPATHGVESGLRKQKKDGYKTCPFDEMITNYDGIVQCIEEDFTDFYNPEYLEIKVIPSESKYLTDDFIIYNKKYKFLFNHESPGHARLWIRQQWEGGINHYIANNFEKFRERYARRIQNFRDYLNSGEQVIFLIVPEQDNNFSRLRNALDKHYHTLKYTILALPYEIDQKHFQDHMDLLK